MFGNDIPFSLALYNPAFLVKLVFNTSITHAHFYRLVMLM